MRISSHLFIVGAAVVAAASSFAFAGESVVKENLAHYFPIRTALAADKVEGVKEHAEALAKSTDKDLAKAATAVGEAKDLAGARKAFAELSKVLVGQVKKAAEEGADIGTVHVFVCPETKPYGHWLQAEDGIGNPYLGGEKLKSGKKVATLGAPAKKGGDGHEGHDHGKDGH